MKIKINLHEGCLSFTKSVSDEDKIIPPAIGISLLLKPNIEIKFDEVYNRNTSLGDILIGLNPFIEIEDEYLKFFEQFDSIPANESINSFTIKTAMKLRQ